MPYLTLTGELCELWGVFSEDLDEIWPHYNDTALYVGLKVLYEYIYLCMAWPWLLIFKCWTLSCKGINCVISVPAAVLAPESARPSIDTVPATKVLCSSKILNNVPWWRHQMETFSASLAICAGYSPVTGEFPTQRPVTWSFDIFFDLCLNKWLNKQWWGWWFETPSHPL